jgi:hypothetical protein
LHTHNQAHQLHAAHTPVSTTSVFQNKKYISFQDIFLINALDSATFIKSTVLSQYHSHQTLHCYKLVSELLHQAVTAQGGTSTWIQSLKNITDNPKAHVIYKLCKKGKKVQSLALQAKCK